MSLPRSSLGSPLFLIMLLLSTICYTTQAFRAHSSSLLRKVSHRCHSALQMNAASKGVRVRFAPSPTGSLHVGGARTALFNWLLARKTKGKFLIRVEDTDEARSTRESEHSILNDLKWLGLNWDEGPEVGGPHGPYRQSERKHIYKAAAEKLIAEGKAYRCFCTEEELEEKRLAAEARGEDPKYDGKWRDASPEEVQKMLDAGQPYTVRFRVPPGKIVSIDDVVRGRVTWDADASLGDFIILRSNGMPVYNFCVSVDDAAMQITHVIRAEEHLTNTLRQMLILEALDYTPPTYAHCSLILGSDRSKLSKRHGATSVTQFAAQGFLPAAMMNYLANLGWNDGTPKEIYSPQELIEAFDLSRIVKSAAVFDMAKLTWINAQHLRALPAAEIQPIVLKEMARGPDAVLAENFNPEGVARFDDFRVIATKIAQRDMDLSVDTNRLLGNVLRYDFDASLESDEEAKEIIKSPTLPSFIQALADDFASGALPRGTEADFDNLWKAYMKSLGGRLGVKGKNLFHPVRFLLTGRMSGPDVGDQIKLLGLARGIVRADYPLVPLEQRIANIEKLVASSSQHVATA